jgi:prephenate dehydrogenase
MLIKRLVVVGVGLIGGSFALALRRAGCVQRVLGIGRDQGNLRKALELGVIDEIATEPGAALRGADFVFIATPVRQIQGVMSAIAPHLSVHAVVTDAGSTKQDVAAAARAAFGQKIGQFVPGHPIAGREKSGVTAADAELYCDRNIVLTPLPENSRETIECVRAAWLACGARVVDMEAAAHDGIFAAVSHLPHMLAYALVDEIAHRDNAAQLFSYAAGGFRDFTRIAGSSPEMWRDIALNNREALLSEIDRYQQKLASLRAMIEDSDSAAIERLMTEARDARDAWLVRFNAPGQQSPE